MPKRPPQNVAQEGNYNTIELYSKVPQNSSKMAHSHILIFPCCHSKCSYIVIRKGLSPCFRTRMIGKTLTRVTAGTRRNRHDRSCLEMSEADGVDGGAFCKRGFIHLQFAEKLEAPEAERHLGSWILE
ncbi:hypothetical protein V1477_003247 [Vespula maculifrons]|uniref:Uncharacterized protein n=1 Tax=Vespula maculifrons TaxID=7453 RepID=A0ABD2CV97_VESMC